MGDLFEAVANEPRIEAITDAHRVLHELVELVETGHITFPRPEAADTEAITTGVVAEVDALNGIGALIARTDAALVESRELPQRSDRRWIDDTVAVFHAHAVRGG